MAMSSVYQAPSTTRPGYDPSDEDAVKDTFNVLSVGSPFRYVIPSFDVLSVELRQMVIHGAVFVRNDPTLVRSYPSRMTVNDSTVVPINEFSVCANIEKLKLPSDGVFVVWEWEWCDFEPDSDGESDKEDATHDENINPYLQSESEAEDEELFSLPPTTQTIIFKCIGTTYHPDSQEALAKVSALMKKNEEVAVRIRKEPENQYDSKAIAFQCNLSNKWIRIGLLKKP